MPIPRRSIRTFVKTLSWFVPTTLFRVARSFFEYFAWCINSRGFAFVGADAYLRSPASIYNPQFISLGARVTAEPGLIIEAFSAFAGREYTPQITIGEGSTLGYNCHIGCIDRVSIAANVLIASHVFISDHTHGSMHASILSLAPSQRPLHSKGPIRIEKNVWIGEGVCILPGVTIGENAIIGANSVVTRDVPKNSIYAGVPARLVRTLDTQGDQAK